MNEKCSYCNRVIRDYRNCATVQSASETGVLIISRICRQCSRDNDKIECVLVRNEKALIISDQQYKWREANI